MSRRGANPCDQLHGSCAQQIANQQKQFTTFGSYMCVSSVKIKGAHNTRIAARGFDLLHRQ